MLGARSVVTLRPASGKAPEMAVIVRSVPRAQREARVVFKVGGRWWVFMQLLVEFGRRYKKSALCFRSNTTFCVMVLA